MNFPTVLPSTTLLAKNKINLCSPKINNLAEINYYVAEHLKNRENISRYNSGDALENYLLCFINPQKAKNIPLIPEEDPAIG